MVEGVNPKPKDDTVPYVTTWVRARLGYIGRLTSRTLPSLSESTSAGPRLPDYPVPLPYYGPLGVPRCHPRPGFPLPRTVSRTGPTISYNKASLPLPSQHAGKGPSPLTNPAFPYISLPRTVRYTVRQVIRCSIAKLNDSFNNPLNNFYYT